MAGYYPAEFDTKWQTRWRDSGLFKASDSPKGKTFYSLVMFPYPSGRAHMGHMRNYSIGDVVARWKKMNGFEVLQPIGWDAFGLPAENAAIKNKTDAEEWTRSNIAAMGQQFKDWGIAYDWDREFATCDVDYYRWNQWFFLKCLEKKLAYRAKSPVNWCPSCATVLANEQVSAEGTCWRCESTVENKELEQWFFRTTAYSQELLDDHSQLETGWPKQVLAMQKNWIGRSEGAEIEFDLESGGTLPVFTTRPDTLFGATFMALSVDHPKALELTVPEKKEECRAFIEEVRRNPTPPTVGADADKRGFFTGSFAINPVNGEKVPIWLADYILMGYGTGAIMAVPAHDSRDFHFASKFGVQIRRVIQGPGEEAGELSEAYEEPGPLVNSGEFDGIASEDAKGKITAKLEAAGKGIPKVTFRLKDWLLSRQRAWGTPIPMVHCGACGIVPVPESDLPVKLPKNPKYTGSGKSPLADCEEWVNVDCPKCGSAAKRETDTMDTFIDSSWYYARYTDPKNTEAIFDSEKANAWLPVDQYIGGIEHACMHLMYARFYHKVLRDLGLLSSDEPFARLLTQGMVTLGGSAMSKSKGNIVDPGEIIKKYSADTARLYILFEAPVEKDLEWKDKNVEGIWRFLNRVWRLSNAVSSGESLEGLSGKEDAVALGVAVNKAVQAVTRDLERGSYNTPISELMSLTNVFYAQKDLGTPEVKAHLRTLTLLLAPFAPHLAEEIWERLGNDKSVFLAPWPEADLGLLAAQKIKLPVQVNGKVRDHLFVSPEASKEDIEREAVDLEKVQRFIEGKQVRKVIVVPKRMVNVVAQ